MIVWTLNVVNELKPKSLWLNSARNGSLICFLNESKPNTWAQQRCTRINNIKGQKLTRCLPSKCKSKPFHHNQGSSIPSLKHPKWTKKKQVAQLRLAPHLVCNIMVKLKVCLFIPCFYVFLNFKNPCSIWCTLFMYIFLKNSKKKKKNQVSQIFPKKNKIKSNEKVFGLGALGLLNHLKKNKNLWIRVIELPSDFFKKTQFFCFFQEKKKRKEEVSFSKWYTRIP